jgi:DNA-binding MarR family transcriptional regulator
MSALGVVEKKVLGALLILSDSNYTVTATQSEIARIMGYKKPGGALTFALKSLEMQNHITKTKDGRYKVLL